MRRIWIKKSRIENLFSERFHGKKKRTPNWEKRNINAGKKIKQIKKYHEYLYSEKKEPSNETIKK